MGDILLEKKEVILENKSHQIFYYCKYNDKVEQVLAITKLKDQNELLNKKIPILRAFYKDFIYDDKLNGVEKTNIYYIFIIEDTVDDLVKSEIENDQSYIKKYLIDNCNKKEDLKEILKENLPCLATFDGIIGMIEPPSTSDTIKRIEKEFTENKRYKFLKQLIQKYQLNEIVNLELDQILKEVEDEVKVY